MRGVFPKHIDRGKRLNPNTRENARRMAQDAFAAKSRFTPLFEA